MATKTKTIKKSTRTTKKAVKPEYIVDLTTVQDLGDAYAAFGWAKIDKYLTPTEIDAVFCEITDAAAPRVIICECPCKKLKKTNIFKRFWNWLTCKK